WIAPCPEQHADCARAWPPPAMRIRRQETGSPAPSTASVCHACHCCASRYRPSEPPRQLPRAHGIAPVARLQVKQLLSQRTGPNLVTVRRLRPAREFPITLLAGVRVLATASFAVRVSAVLRLLERTEHVEWLALSAAR